VGGAKHAHLEVASVDVPRQPVSFRALHQLSLSMLENHQGKCEKWKCGARARRKRNVDT